MCTPLASAIGGLAISTYSSYAQQKATASAYQDYMDQNARAKALQTNYDNMNLQINRQNAFDAAVEELLNTKLQSMDLNAPVKVAVNENMTGRTANQIIRTSEGDLARATSSIKTNYQQKANEIDQNKYANIVSTREYLNSLNASAPKMPSRFSNFMDFASNTVGAYTSYANATNAKKISKSKSVDSKSNSTQGYSGNFQSLSLNRY